MFPIILNAILNISPIVIQNPSKYRMQMLAALVWSLEELKIRTICFTVCTGSLTTVDSTDKDAITLKCVQFVSLTFT